MQKNVVLHRPGWIYRDHPTKPRMLSATKENWLRTPQTPTDDPAEPSTAPKRFLRIKPQQIQLEAEEIDQENRQLLNALACVQQINQQLRVRLEEEQTATRRLWEAKVGAHPVHTPPHQLDNGQDADNSRKIKTNLARNLSFQIFLTEKEHKKVLSELQSLKNTDAYFQFVENTTIKNVYKEEIGRLQALQPVQPAPEELVPEAEFEKLVLKIEKCNQKIARVKAKLSQKKLKMEQTQAAVDQGEAQESRLEYHLRCLNKDNASLAAKHSAKAAEVATLQAQVDRVGAPVLGHEN